MLNKSYYTIYPDVPKTTRVMEIDDEEPGFLTTQQARALLNQFGEDPDKNTAQVLAEKYVRVAYLR